METRSRAYSCDDDDDDANIIGLAYSFAITAQSLRECYQTSPLEYRTNKVMGL